MLLKRTLIILSITMVVINVLRVRTHTSVGASKETTAEGLQLCQGDDCDILALKPNMVLLPPRRGEDLIPRDHCVLEAMRKQCPWDFSCFLGTLAPFVADIPTIVNIQTQTQKNGKHKGYKFVHRKDSHCRDAQIGDCVKQAEQECEMDRLLGL